MKLWFYNLQFKNIAAMHIRPWAQLGVVFSQSVGVVYCVICENDYIFVVSDTTHAILSLSLPSADFAVGCTLVALLIILPVLLMGPEPPP
jgi:hypothetical protein